VLEQFAEPEEILASPGTEFVAGFLGSDRGIKRLSLLQLDATTLIEGPVVAAATRVTEAQQIMDRHALDWVVVVIDGRLVGTVSRAGLRGEIVGESEVEPLAAKVDVTATLKDALDVIVSSNGRYAAVCDANRYLGLISTDAISQRIASR
jgi:osmoprotectant transport system ATP-binding protein